MTFFTPCSQIYYDHLISDFMCVVHDVVLVNMMFRVVTTSTLCMCILLCSIWYWGRARIRAACSQLVGLRLVLDTGTTTKQPRAALCGWPRPHSTVFDYDVIVSKYSQPHRLHAGVIVYRLCEEATTVFLALARYILSRRLQRR